MGNTSTCDCKCDMTCKIDKYLDIKNCLCKKLLIGKLVLECEDEILNTTEISLDDKKVTCEENNCLINMISFAILCLLLLALSLSLALSIGCHYYYTRDWMNK